MAEGGGLLNRCTVKSRTGGSNPPLSAILRLYPLESMVSCGIAFSQLLGNVCKLCVTGGYPQLRPTGGLERARWRTENQKDSTNLPYEPFESATANDHTPDLGVLRERRETDRR